MKSKLLCMILILNLIGSVCYAENTTTIDSEIPAASSGRVDDSTPDNMSKDEYISFVETIINQTTSEDFILLSAESVNSYFNISESRFFKNNNELSSVQKQALTDILINLYESVNTHADRVEDAELIRKIGDSISNNGNYSHENEMIIFIRDGNLIDEEYWVAVNDIGIATPWGHYYTDNPQQIITDVEKTIFTYKNILLDHRVSIVESKANKKEVIERLLFNVTLSEKTTGTIFDEFGNAGDVLECSIEQVTINNREYFILSIEGEKGKETYFADISGLDLSGGNAGNTLEFTSNKTYDGSSLSIEMLTGWEKATFIISGKSEENKVTEVSISVDSKGKGKSIKMIPADSIDYEFVSEENTMNSKRNLHVLFGISKEELINKAETENKQQDPENYITEMRGSYEDGKEIIDFYFSFVGEANIKELSSTSPEWFKKLGDNVKATIVGVTQTLNGKDRRSYTMIRFSGDNGIKWFDNNVTEPKFDEKNNEYSVYNSFDSLTSFNGFQKVKNTKDYESTSATLYFNNDENKTLNSIVFNVGNNKIKVLEKDIKYIGGGKIAYEKLW